MSIRIGAPRTVCCRGLLLVCFTSEAGTGHHAEANQLVNSGQLLTVRNVRLGLKQTS